MTKREKARRFIYDDLNGKCCVDCGETDVVILTYDHVRGVKKGNVSDLVKTGCIETLTKEIKKCEVRCFNCHMRKTALQQDWYADLL